MQQIKKIPTLAELYSDNIESFNDKQNIMFLLNQEPKKEWLKAHPQTRMLYMPIGRVEYLLNMLFPLWSVEVINFAVLANSVSVQVRLKLEFPDGATRCFDGLGAAPLQTNAGAGATDFAQIKSAAVQMALPSAKSYAIKDAADHVGKIFGRDVNREALQQAAFQIESAEVQKTPELSETHLNQLHDLKSLVLSVSSIEELQTTWKRYADEIEYEPLKAMFNKIVKIRKEEILANGK
jgi:hypothetical protein